MPPQQTNVTSGTERDAAGLGLDLPIALASEPRILSWLERYWRAFQERRQRLDSRAAVADLSDANLKDIGLTRDEIEYITPERAIDRLRENAYLWGRGAM